MRRRFVVNSTGVNSATETEDTSSQWSSTAGSIDVVVTLPSDTKGVKISVEEGSDNSIGDDDAYNMQEGRISGSQEVPSKEYYATATENVVHSSEHLQQLLDEAQQALSVGLFEKLRAILLGGETRVVNDCV